MATKTLKSAARKVNGMSAKTAAVRKAMDKNIAKNEAKRAAKTARTGKAGPAGLAKLFPMNEAARKEAAKAKPASGPSPATLGAAAAKADDLKAQIEALRAKGRATGLQSERNKLAKARRELEATLAALPKAPKAAKPAKASKQAETKPMTGSKATIADMMRRPNGATEAEVCKKLGWQAAGATISRVIKLLPAGSVTKTKGEDGKTRYIAA